MIRTNKNALCCFFRFDIFNATAFFFFSENVKGRRCVVYEVHINDHPQADK